MQISHPGRLDVVRIVRKNFKETTADYFVLVNEGSLRVGLVCGNDREDWIVGPQYQVQTRNRVEDRPEIGNFEVKIQGRFRTRS